MFITSEYGEFGFSFDIQFGESWPYSDCFWTIDKGRINTAIYICVDGKSRKPVINIDANGERVVDECTHTGREMIGKTIIK